MSLRQAYTRRSRWRFEYSVFALGVPVQAAPGSDSQPNRNLADVGARHQLGPKPGCSREERLIGLKRDSRYVQGGDLRLVEDPGAEWAC